jgi:hypothetical protein
MGYFGWRSGTAHGIRYKTKVYELTSGTTIKINAAKASVFTLVPAHDSTISVVQGVSGQMLTLSVTTSGAVSKTLTFGTGFKATATLATGTDDAKVFTVTFVHDGVSFKEISRTAAM